MHKVIKFPKNFLWGGATSAPQIEGFGNTSMGKTTWEKYYKEKPEDFYDGVGPSITNDFTVNYKNDLKLFKEIGSNSFRLSISWARLIPDGKNVSKKGLNFYHKVINECIELEMEPIVNLFHFDMPLWAYEEGSWASRKVIQKFVKFADLVFSEFGHKVKKFTTFNEPIVHVLAMYSWGAHWPLEKDLNKAVEEGFGTILAHAKVVNLFNSKYKAITKSKIGVIINVSPSIAKDVENATKEDFEAVNNFDIIHNLSMLIPMTKGAFPKKVIEFFKRENLMPTYSNEEIKEISNIKIDFLGANYYSPSRVQSPDKNLDNIEHKFFRPYKSNQARYNVFRGWEIRPESIYDLAMFIKNELNNIPFYISENGMGVEGEERFRDKKTGLINDAYRINFIKEHLNELSRAIDDGSNCFGYHVWSVIDNWSWRNAYKNRYGLIEINLKTQARLLKKSAYWWKELTTNNGFIFNGEKVEDAIDLKNIEYKESV